MIFIHDIDNNILDSNERFLGVYQDKSEKWELYQEINIFWLEPNKKTVEILVRVTHAIINIYNIELPQKNSERSLGVEGLSLK